MPTLDQAGQINMRIVRGSLFFVVILWSVLFAECLWAFESKPIAEFWLSTTFAKIKQPEQEPITYEVFLNVGHYVEKGLLDSLRVATPSQAQPMSIFLVNQMALQLQPSRHLPWREVVFILDEEFPESARQSIVSMSFGIGYNHVVMYLKPDCQSRHVIHYYVNDSYSYPMDATWTIAQELLLLNHYHGICKVQHKTTEYRCKPFAEGCH